MQFLPLVFSIIAGAVGILMGMVFFDAIAGGACPDPANNPSGFHDCQNTKNMGWTVLGILPLGMFVTVFFIFRNVFDSY